MLPSFGARGGTEGELALMIRLKDSSRKCMMVVEMLQVMLLHVDSIDFRRLLPYAVRCPSSAVGSSEVRPYFIHATR